MKVLRITIIISALFCSYAFGNTPQDSASVTPMTKIDGSKWFLHISPKPNQHKVNTDSKIAFDICDTTTVDIKSLSVQIKKRGTNGKKNWENAELATDIKHTATGCLRFVYHTSTAFNWRDTINVKISALDRNDPTTIATLNYQFYTLKGPGIQSLFNLLKLAGNIGIAIGVVFALGLFFIILEFFNKNSDKKRSKRILKLSVRNKETRLKQIVDEINDPEQMNTISKLLSRMYEVYKESKTSERLNEEISKYKQLLQEKFDTFKNRMAFFSDTCGALGLIGTVWGMYRTFHGGLLDPQMILTGMGIALITTLLGLVASIILNAGTSEIIAAFNKTLDELTEKSYDFQLRLMSEEKKFFTEAVPQKVIIEKPAVTSATELEQMPKTIETPAIQKIQEEIIEPQQITAVNNKMFQGTVMAKLEDLLEVKVFDNIERPLASQDIIFKIEKGSGRFSNGKSNFEIQTDSKGVASTEMTLGNKIGDIVVVAEVKNKPLNCRFKIKATAEKPSILHYISGNYQNGSTGSTLPEPLVVQITDQYNNPIRDYKVKFSVESGSGRFPGSTSTDFEGTTDPDGILAVPFILGDEPGTNKISVHAKGLKESSLEFVLFAQPRGG